MNREYFENLRSIINQYNVAMGAFQAEAASKRETLPEDEYQEWYARTVPPRTASGSDIMLLEYYDRLGENEEFVIGSDMGAYAVPRLIGAMRRAGLDSFVYAVTDRNCFDRLDDFCFEDCKLDKPVQVRQFRHGKMMETTGIRILL